MAILGLLSFFQMIFIPGYIFLKVFKFERSVIYKP